MSTVERVRYLIHQGNIRRVVVSRDGRTVAAFPLTFGVIGAVVAPPLAAVTLVAALVTGSAITVERIDRQAGDEEPADQAPLGALTA